MPGQPWNRRGYRQRINENVLTFLVHARDLSQDHHGLFVVPQNHAEGSADQFGRQFSRRYLVEKRLERVVVRSVHECLEEGNSFSGDIVGRMGANEGRDDTRDDA